MKPKVIHLESSYTIKAPREAVYKIITDFENAPKNFPSVAKSAKFLSRDGDNFTVEARTKAFFGSKTYIVRMEGKFNPPVGFTSTNTSSVGIEHEVFTMEEIPEGTKIHYLNDVEITSPFFRLFGGFMIKRIALKYWEWAVIDKLKKMLEK